MHLPIPALFPEVSYIKLKITLIAKLNNFTMLIDGKILK